MKGWVPDGKIVRDDDIEEELNLHLSTSEESSSDEEAYEEHTVVIYQKMPYRPLRLHVQCLVEVPSSEPQATPQYVEVPMNAELIPQPEPLDEVPISAPQPLPDYEYSAIPISIPLPTADYLYAPEENMPQTGEPYPTRDFCRAQGQVELGVSGT